MNLRDFTEPQKHALLDLAMLAMYADGHLAHGEDARILRLLGMMGFDSEYDHARQYDAAVTRVSRHSGTKDKAREYAAACARVFSPEQRVAVEEALDGVVASDRHVAAGESDLLSVVRDVLQK